MRETNDDEDNKIIPDRGRVRVRLMAMDSADNFYRPGYRQMTKQVRDAAGISDARRQSYEEYSHYVQNAWRGSDEYKNPNAGRGDPPTVGTHELYGSREGQSCTKNGFAGILVRGEGGELECRIPQEFTEGNFDSDTDFKGKQKRNARNQEEGEEDLEKDSLNKARDDLKAAYSAYDSEISQQWRKG